MLQLKRRRELGNAVALVTTGFWSDRGDPEIFYLDTWGYGVFK